MAKYSTLPVKKRSSKIKPEVLSIKSSSDSELSTYAKISCIDREYEYLELMTSKISRCIVGDTIGPQEVPAKLTELYLDLRSAAEEHVRGFTEPLSEALLPDLHPQEQHVFTLVLDLNETLLYSDWKRDRGWRTFKRPGVDEFLEHLAQFYEIIVYSDQQSMYVDPIVDRLDGKHCIRYRLSRAATRYQDGKHYRFHRFATHILLHSGGDVHEVPGALRNKLKLWRVCSFTSYYVPNH